MATFKEYISAFNKNNQTRVTIRVTHKREKKYIRTEIWLTKNDVTKTGKIRSTGIQDDIDTVIRGYREEIRKLGMKVNSMSVDGLVNYLTESKVDHSDFVKFAEKKITELKANGQKGTASNYSCAINSLKKFVGRESVAFDEITANFLRDYEVYLKSSDPKLKKVAVKGRAISLYTGIFRKLINDAKRDLNDEDHGIIRINISPFLKYKVPSMPETEKRALTVKQIQIIRDMQIPKTDVRANLARDCFMLSFYLIGMNSADMYLCNLLKKDRITYFRKKTTTRRKDKAEISLKIFPEAIPLFAKYADEDKDRVFNFYKLYCSDNTFNQAINKGLKQIAKKLEFPTLQFYAARHSWATIAINECKIDKYTVHSALNHVDETMRVTDIYIKKSWENIDEANRKVLDLLAIPIPDEEKKTEGTNHLKPKRPSRKIVKNL